MTDVEQREGTTPVLRRGPSKVQPRRLWGVVALLAVGASLLGTGVGRGELVKPDGLTLVGEFFAAALDPRRDLEFLRLTGNAALTTLGYAVLGTALSLVIGLVGGILTSETWWRTGDRRRRSRVLAGWAIARGVLVVPRAIHEVVWGLVFLSIFGITPLVAVLAIGIPFGAVTAKVYSELLDETSQRAYSALSAAGASRRAALLYGLFPPAMSDLLAYAFYRFDCAIRSAAILGIIGAGGLGFQLALSFQTLQYNEIWTFLYTLIALCALTDLWSSVARSRRARAGTGARRDRILVGSAVVGAVLVPSAAWWVSLDLTALWADETWELVSLLLADAWPPRADADGLTGLLSLAGGTLSMSILAMVLAFCGAALLAFPAANSLLTRPVIKPFRSTQLPARATRLVVVGMTRTLFILLRAVPPPVWALLFLFVLFPGILPGALALGIYTLGVLGRLMAESVENLDQRPLMAMCAQGVPRRTVFCYGVIPPATPHFVAYGLYRWEVTIRETVVVGVVGAGGLGLVFNEQLAAFDYAGTLGTLTVLIVLTLLVDLTSAAVRRSLR